MLKKTLISLLVISYCPIHSMQKTEEEFIMEVREVSHEEVIKSRAVKGKLKQKYDILLAAIRTDNLPLVESLTEDESLINACDSRGYTPLMCASELGSSNMVQLLIESNAEANTYDLSGDSPLIYAATGGHIAAIELLIDYGGASVYPGGPCNKSPLICASERGYYKIAEFLIKCGAKVDNKDYFGNTPLSVAVKVGSLNLCSLLLAYGADVNLSADAPLVAYSHEALGGTPLLYAAKNGHEVLCLLLVRLGADGNVADSLGLTVLMYAAKTNCLKLAEVLINKGVEVTTCVPSLKQYDGPLDKRPYPGDTALHYAAINGNAQLIKLLFDHNAKVDSTDKKMERTPLMCAAMHGSVEACKCLLDNGADIDATDKLGNTALILTAGKGFLEVGDLLLQRGASVNALNLAGTSALHEAVRVNDLTLCLLLLNNGADVTMEDIGGTPLSQATNVLMRNLFREHGTTD